MTEHLTPYQVCERIIGRAEMIAAASGVSDKAPYGWSRASARRAAGDIPSPVFMRRLLAHAAARRLPLTADHLIWGATAAEIAALMADQPAVGHGPPAPISPPEAA